MRISVFGLGYVGTVSAGCFASLGHKVIGVDPIRTKVELINGGKTPIIEAEIGEIIADARRSRRLSATDNEGEAIAETEISFVCVGTPSQANGNLDLSYMRRVCEMIGEALKSKEDGHTVVIRSTILPGTMRTTVISILEEKSGKRVGENFDVCYNPEFLREGSAVHDFRYPPKTVIGQIKSTGGDLLASLYEHIEAPLIRTGLEIAEMVKYVDNTWHALKTGFANEIGAICKSFSVDSHEVMDIFCQDTKLNISRAYLSPGFAFGGSCLPKDVRALSYAAKMRDVEIPIIKSVLPSNDLQIARGLQLITAKGNQKIGVLGLSFKAGTDDLRESPMIEVIERLLGKGYDLRVFDKNVSLARLVGANRDFILNRIPHISRLMAPTVEDVLQHAETVVIGNREADFTDVPNRLREDQVVVDLVRIAKQRSIDGKYDGICW